MHVMQVIHNPTAGNGELSKEKLIAMLEEAGYTCQYTSTKEDGWKEFKTRNADMILIAGGDGTVRRACKQLLEKNYRENPLPVALLPLGTANNLSKTLRLEMDASTIIQSLCSARIRKFGIGILKHVPDETFFMESFGYGVFPYLMMEMKKRKAPEANAAEEIEAALQLLHDLVLTYPPRHCRLQVDGIDHSGDYIMAEIMNIKSIGPNLFISPNADPADGVFEVVMVSAGKKQQFADYLQRTLNGDKLTFEFIEFSGKNIRISWEGTHVHVDDKLIKLKENTEVKISAEESVFRFLIPGGGDGAGS